MWNSTRLSPVNDVLLIDHEAMDIEGERVVLADDILVVAHGSKCDGLFVKALDETHTYIKTMGGKLAEGKSQIFASNEEHRDWFKKSTWQGTGGNIEVVNDMRYLGAHLNVSGKRKATTCTARIKGGIIQLGN